MYLSSYGASSGDKRLSAAKTSLNPNATEFVPSFLRSPSVADSSVEANSKFAISTPGKGILDRSESSASNNSDDEAKQYWRDQLPDDITPDFNFMGTDDNTQEINGLLLSSLSLNDVNEGSRYSASTGNGFNGNSYSDKMRYSSSSYGGYPSPREFQPSITNPWDKHIVSNDQLLAREGPLHNGNTRNALLGDLSNEQLFMENADVNPLEFLALQFPGFAAESLTEVYFANGGDLNLTIEMLTQLELQVDGGLNQTLNPKALSAPNLSAMDFPALAGGQNGLAKFNGDNLRQNGSPYRASETEGPLLFRSNSSIPSRGATDFAAAVRKVASQDSSIWKYDRNGSTETSIGSSRSSQVLASSYNRGPNRGSAHASPIWLETGEAVANMYSEMREEARDHARVRNAYFEQARQAYLVGNKALAKDLSVKGQLHNMQMKAAHGKAQETIYRQRNSEIPTNGRERMIDLHGLHVSEALHVLKRELVVMRNAARSADQRLLVYICVGTGHHTRGSRTPARLPVAVQRYLLEDEGLDYTEPQPGLLRVVVY